jgi:photosystem II stability/assembly factor-like uncharacterized protein
LYAAVSWHGGLYASTDGGADWHAVRTPFPSNGVQALAIDPHDSETVYVSDCGGACSHGVFERTNDGGTSWQLITGVPWTVQSLAIDPQRPSTLFAGTIRGDIFRSSDNGRSWQQVSSPPTLPQSRQYAIIAIAIDPTSTDTIYAARRFGGIIKSSDGGATWSRANTGLVDLHVNALAIDQSHPRVLYVSTGAPSSGETAHVFRSTDGALRWHPLDAGLPGGGVTALAIGPTGRVFASTEGDGVVQLRQPNAR